MRSFLFFSPCFLGMPGLRERRIAGGSSRISLRLFGVWDGRQYAFACRVRAGEEVGEDVVLFGVFAFVGGGRGVISYSTPPPRPGPPFPQVCPMAPTLAGEGGCSQRGHLGSEWQNWFAPAPSPPQRGAQERLQELPRRPAPPAPRTHRQSETAVPHLAAPTLAPRPPRPPPPPCLPGAGAPAWPPVT